MVNEICKGCFKHTDNCICDIKFCPFCGISMKGIPKHEHFHSCKKRRKYLQKKSKVYHDFCSHASSQNIKYARKSLNLIKKSAAIRNKTKKYNQYCFDVSCKNASKKVKTKDVPQKSQNKINPPQERPLMCRKCYEDTSMCCCGHECCPLCGIFISNPSQESLQDHYMYCKNINKQQCQKCFKFFAKKNYSRHVNLKQDCRNIISYNCLFCGEVWNTSRQLTNHLKIRHLDIYSYKEKLEMLVKKSNPLYRGPMPWDSPQFNVKMQKQIFELYVYHSSSIFYNEAVEGGLFSSRFSLVLCNNVPELAPDTFSIRTANCKNVFNFRC